jgi:DNA polymerase-4
VESFELDECWVDVSGSVHLFGTTEMIAEEIRERVKRELGITVSVGVSYNKVFAKLGSDLKKPDAVSVLTRDNYREKVWPLPASDLLYVGRATTRKLYNHGILTMIFADYSRFILDGHKPLLAIINGDKHQINIR